MNRRLIVVILLILPCIHSYKIITILSDFTDNKDLEFFKTTLPWIVENIGSDISLNFHFKDSGINSGPRKCYLLQLERNIYLQADYLSCLAHGKAQNVCAEHLPINKFYFKRCLRNYVKFFVKNAELQFRKIKVDTTPIIILPRRKILTDTTPQNTMKNICSLFPFWKPIGCIATSPYPDQTTKPNEDMESTTTQKPNSEDEATPEEEKQPNKNSTQKSVTNPEEEQQPNESSTRKDVTKPDEEKQTSESSTPGNVTKTVEEQQPNESSTPRNVTKPNEEKQTSESSTPENVTMTEIEQQTNERSTPENVTKTEEEKQPGDNVTPRGDIKPAEKETPTVKQSEREPEK